MSWRSQGHKLSTSLYVMKCPGDRKDTLNKCSTVYFIVCKYNKLSWRSQGHKCSASLYLIHIESTFICP